MFFHSFSLAFSTILMIILPSDYIGMGLGIHKSSNSSKIPLTIRCDSGELQQVSFL
ncbi:hypothetical protein BDB00DRAFT_848682 [Zychaea mexicana]|uniref:uncharacterized protein n=1 Tax=Zychaea mexicana TaxID=64656 RepID=UPI0022FE1EE3|nr:uncharacterized protein BDB00DRAFT_848682 [Zychaea mexicana]KAI9488314.1 hypothetical protein BDB00DRAFT_848682 [Zychaea mexicana]